MVNGEHSQNGSAQSPYPQNAQDEDDYQAVSISYVNFTLRIDLNNAIRSDSDGSQQHSTIATDALKDIQFAIQLIEEGKTNKELFQFLGTKLYQMIFPSEIDNHFNATEAAAKGRMVRIRLNIEPDTLAVLPWEFLYREEGGYFLVVNPNTVLARYPDLSRSPDLPSKQGEPLHLLIIIANPTDQTPLDPNEWERIIRQALRKPLQQDKITIQTVKQATFEQIRDALLHHKPDMIQFVGHGIYHDGKGYLALVNSTTGKTWEVDDSLFANIFLGLGVEETLRLVTLATCESAKSDSPRAFLGIASQIVQRGVPIVVAMRYSIPVEIAEIYLENFYTVVAARRPVDWAVQHTRNAISIKTGLSNREFATPVLYMRATDGNIF